MNATTLVAIVVPSLNEEIAVMLESLGDQLRRSSYSFEVLVVDDSREPHLSRVRSEIDAFNAQGTPNVRISLIEGPHTGKGSAVREGVRRSQGEIVLLIDCDLPVPLEHIEPFVNAIARGEADVVLAERPLEREFTDAKRLLASRGLLILQRLLVFHSGRYTDTQCGFKAYRGDLLRSIVERQVVVGGMYDVEYLYAAGKRGARIKPVTVSPNPEKRPTKINLLRCLRNDPVDLAKVKLTGVLGGYDPAR